MSFIIEEQLASLTKAIEGLAKCAHEQDAKLFKLTNKMDSMIERRSIQAPLKLPKVQVERDTRRVVSMIELTKACQGEDELVVDFINRWRSLSLNCKDRLSKLLVLKCASKGLKSNTFEELATCAHDMELSMTLRVDQQSPVCGPHEDEDIEELQSGGKSASEDDFEESMYI
ncbi:hypothetical protein H5410_015288 [Solanum commersonii]|uniref:Uncharacterized protein n=1 Tax=Solanum commersonii TaxID=4109 RepID=A0A9J5ZTF1_SOLCO|nr:hypothetical protein H5410_015288 [Solanum commersonii]